MKGPEQASNNLHDVIDRMMIGIQMIVGGAPLQEDMFICLFIRLSVHPFHLRSGDKR